MIAGRGGPSIKFRSFDKEIECLCKTAAAKITRQTGYSGTSSSWFLHRSGLPVRSAFVVGQDARGRLTPSSAPLTRHATTPEIWGCATTLPHWPANKRSDGTILFVASSRHSAIFAFFFGQHRINLHLYLSIQRARTSTPSVKLNHNPAPCSLSTYNHGPSHQSQNDEGPRSKDRKVGCTTRSGTVRSRANAAQDRRHRNARRAKGPRFPPKKDRRARGTVTRIPRQGGGEQTSCAAGQVEDGGDSYGGRAGGLLALLELSLSGMEPGSTRRRAPRECDGLTWMHACCVGTFPSREETTATY